MNKKLLFLGFTGLLFACFNIRGGEHNDAQEVWLTLVGEKFSNRPEFAFIQNNPTLPNVLLYGDSISIHYTQRVRENLADQANVYRLYRNGGESSSFINKMTKMHSSMQNPALQDGWSFQWDVIHFNVGLHDLKYVVDGKLDKINGEQVSSLAQYKVNLRNIVLYLKQLAPNAKLIFATTTPVPAGAEGRIEGDAVKYNMAALAVLRDFPEVIINDLYRFTKPNHANWWIKPGDVHYNELGRTEQGNEVANVISSHAVVAPLQSAKNTTQIKDHLDDKQ